MLNLSFPCISNTLQLSSFLLQAQLICVSKLADISDNLAGKIMLCCKCNQNLFLTISTVPKWLFSQSVRCHSTKWLSSTFNLTLHNYQQVPQTYQLELGEADIPDVNPNTPSILAVHPSGSSYKQSNSGVDLLTLSSLGPVRVYLVSTCLGTVFLMGGT